MLRGCVSESDGWDADESASQQQFVPDPRVPRLPFGEAFTVTAAQAVALESARSQEEKERFAQKRKQHYENEFAAVRALRAKLTDSDEEKESDD